MVSVMQVFDTQGLQPVAQEFPIAMKGEAYKIEVDIRYPDGAAELIDFGQVKAVEDVKKSITIVNTGKYPVGFKFSTRTQVRFKYYYLNAVTADVHSQCRFTICHKGKKWKFRLVLC